MEDLTASYGESTVSDTPKRRRKSFWIGLFVLLLLAGFVGFLIYNALQLVPQTSSVVAVEDIVVDAYAASGRLAEAVQFQTVSSTDPAAWDSAAFLGFHVFLKDAFPLVDSLLKREVVSDLSLLYTWPGQDPSMKPILLMGHMDVVPVPPGTEIAWSHPPFSGARADGFVWGRGTLDDKVGVLGTLEAVEHLLRDGFVPQRTIYLAFGHDEETRGSRGAQVIAERLTNAGVWLEFVLDEGGVVTEEVIPGVEQPVALIGTAEKGYLTVELSTTAEGGHSSVPPRHTAVGRLSRAIANLESHPVARSLEGPTLQMFERLAPSMRFLEKTAFANLWLFKPLVLHQLSQNPLTDAAIRTTTAATVIKGGAVENVLPTSARALVNFRIVPGETSESVLEHVREAIDDDDVTVTKAGGYAAEPSQVSDPNAPSFALLERTIQQTLGSDVLVAPYLVVGGTDARYFEPIADNVYRFVPIMLNGNEDADRIHGLNERVRIDDYVKGVQFYYQLMRNASGKP